MRRREDPRRLAANALSLTRKALFQVQRAQWRVKHSRIRDPTLAEWLYVIEIILRRLVIRLETIVSLGIVTRDLASLPYELVREVSSAGAPPQLAPLLEDLESILSALYESASQPIPDAPEAQRASGAALVSEDARRILEEARKEARRRVSEEGLAQ